MSPGEPNAPVTSQSDPVCVASCAEPSLNLDALFFLGFRDMGSKDMTRDRGTPSGPMSTDSTRLIFLSQLDVGLMVVGRVMVEVIMYDMVPLSNLGKISKGIQRRRVKKTYVHACMQAFGRKF